MKKTFIPYLLFAGIFFCCSTSVLAQVQCPYDNVIFGTSDLSGLTTVGDEETLTTCIFGGEFRTVTNLTAGYEYLIETCPDSDFDTQLSIYPAGGGTGLDGNDDFCGLQSQVLFTAPADGDYDILVDEFFCAGNSICMTLRVELTELPVMSSLVCNDGIVVLPPTGSGTVNPLDLVSLDDGSAIVPADLSISQSTFSCADIGANLVTLTYPNSVNGSCTATVFVQDQTPPEALCIDPLQLQLDIFGDLIITPSDINDSSTDNCAVSALNIEPTNFGVGDIGVNAVEMTVTDVSGNVSTCLTNLEVLAPDSPAFDNCPVADIEVSTDAGECFAVVTYPALTVSPDGGGLITPVLLAGLPSGAEFPVGTTQVTWGVADAFGNLVTCTFNVVVTDDEPPAVACADITVPLNSAGNAFIPIDCVPGSGCVFGTTGTCLVSGFSGDFAPGNWAATNVGSGNTDDSGAPASIAITSDDAIPNLAIAPTASFSITIPEDGNLSFDWDWTSTDVDGSQWDPFSFDVNGTATQLTDDGGAANQSGSETLGVNGGDTFTFIMSSDGIGGPATTVISNFSFDPVNCTLGGGTCTPQPLVTSTDVPQTIGPDGNTTAVSTLAVSDLGTICDVNITVVGGHTWQGDLDFFLESPAGTIVHFADRDFCAADDWEGFTVDEDTGVAPACPNGTYISDGSVGEVFALGVSTDNTLDAFDGQGTSGTWTLYINDDAGGDEGTLGGWSLEFSTLAAPSGGACSPIAAVSGGGADIPAGAPGVTAGQTTSTVNVTDTGVVCDVNVTTNGTHTWIGDLDFWLQSPSGTVVHYRSDDGGAADWDGFTFDDEAGAAEVFGVNGTYTPNGDGQNAVGFPGTSGTTLGTFDGELAAGTWTLIIEDDAAGDFGVLTDWELNLSVQTSAATDGATDNCGVQSVVVSQNFFDCSNIGANTIITTVTDENGNVTTCESIVNVVDNTPPQILSCPPDLTMNLVLGCQTPIDEVQDYRGLVTAFDACGYEVIQVPAPGTPILGLPGVGGTIEDGDAFTVELTVLDLSAGNQGACRTGTANCGPGTGGDVCSFTVTLEDDVAPTVFCPDDRERDLDDNCLYVMEDFTGDVIVFDNCDLTITQDPPVGTFLNHMDSPVTVTMTVDDGSNPAGTCTFLLTLNDLTPPVFTGPCPTFAPIMLPPGVCEVAAADIPGLLDVSGGGIVIPPQVLMYNSATDSPDAFPLDLPPGAPGTTSGLVTTTINVPDNGVITDVAVSANGLHSWVGDLDFFIESPAGTRVHFYNDPCGDVDNFDFVSSDGGTNTPISACPPLGGIDLNSDGTGEDPFMPNGVGGINPTMFSAFAGEDPAGTWTLYARDNLVGDFGQLDGWGLDITIAGSVIPDPTAIAIDACGGPVTIDGIRSDGAALTDPFRPCDTEITWTATDESGNTSILCTSTVTITEMDAPTVACNAGPITIGLNEMCEATLDPAFLGSGADACSEVTLSVIDLDGQGTMFDCDDHGMTYNYALQATDCSGNFSICNTSVTILDQIPPTWDLPQGDLDANFDCVDDAIAYFNGILPPPASDNCVNPLDPLNPLTSPLDPATAGIVIVSNTGIPATTAERCDFTWTIVYGASDGKGNVTGNVPGFPHYTVTITVLDDIDPVWTTASNALNGIFDCGDDAGIIANLATEPVGTDNCGDPFVALLSTVEVDLDADGTCNGGNGNRLIRIEQTYSLTDSCGNVADDDFVKLTRVRDNEAPTIDPLPMDLTEECFGVSITDLAAAITVPNPIPTDGSYTPIAGNPLDAWIANLAGADASDCSILDLLPDYLGGDINGVNALEELTWFYVMDPVVSTCGINGTVDVTFTVQDVCGNSVDATATFTLEDTTDPDFVDDPVDLTVECNQPAPSDPSGAFSSWLNNIAGARALDDCDAEADLTITIIDANGMGIIPPSEPGGLDVLAYLTANFTGCNGTGSMEFTFIATDQCGNFTTDAATFSIIDTDEPELTAPAMDMTVQCDGSVDPGNAFAMWLANFAGSAADDDCGGVTPSTNPANPMLSDECGATGSIQVEFVWSDDCGNSVSDFATFTVEDTEAPVITMQPSNMMVECDGAGNVADLVAWLASNGGATATDNCGAVTWSTDPDPVVLSDECGATGSVTVIFTATDPCGLRTDTDPATFTIVDNTDPVFDVLPQDVTEECDGTGVDAQVQSWLATGGNSMTSDVCGGTTVTNDYDPGNIVAGCSVNNGSVTVVFTVTDDCGNAVTASATYTVEDVTAPIVTAPADFTQDTDPGVCCADVAAGDVTASVDEACSPMGNLTMEHSFDGGSTWLPGLNANDGPDGSGCWPVGTTTVSYRATDECGNVSAVDTQDVTIEDNEDPMLTCPADIVVQTVDDCNQVVSWITPVPTDNCPGVVLSDPVVTSGNPDIVFNIDPISGLVIAEFPVGTTTIEYTATDVAGNSTGCSFTVTVEDNDEPEILSCPPDITYNLNSDCNPPVVLVEDYTNLVQVDENCDYIVTQSPAPGTDVSTLPGITPAPGEMYTVTLTVTDVNGNAAIGGNAVGDPSSCEFTVTFVDSNDPSITCAPPADQEVDADCLNYELPDLTDDVVVSDNCAASITVTQSPAPGSYPTPASLPAVVTVTLTADDGNGNQATCTTDITIVDGTEAVLANCPTDETVMASGQDCDAPVSLTAPTATDACDGPLTVSWTLSGATTGSGTGDIVGETFNAGITTVTWSATDAAGNVAECTTTVQVDDNVFPNALCDDFLAALSPFGTVEICANNLDNGSFDSCGEPITLQIERIDVPSAPSQCITFTCDDIGDVPVALIVTDASGNVSTCESVISVSDFIPPVIDTCPADVTVGNDIDECGATLTFDIEASDNCDMTVDYSVTGATSISGSGSISAFTGTYSITEFFSVGVSTIAWTVTDAGGNSVTCETTVTVDDVQAPEVLCQDDVTVDNDPGLCLAQLSFESPLANCNPTGTPTTSDYDVEAITFAPLPATTTEVSWPGAIPDDGVSLPVPIGFDFEMYESTYNEFVFNSNGYISFNTGTTNDACCTGDPLPAADIEGAGIAVLWEDLDPATPDPSTITYGTSGTPGSQVFQLTLTNVSHWPGPGVDPVTVQLLLFEGSNIIEIHTTSQPQAVGTHTQGIQGGTGGPAVTIPGRNSAAWTVTTPDAYRFSPSGPPIGVGAVSSFCDNCPGGTATYELTGATMESGAGNINTNFNVGTTTVTWTITDDAGNTGSCSFDVTVEDNEPPTLATEVVTNDVCETGTGTTGLLPLAGTSGASDYTTSIAVDVPITDITISMSGTHTWNGDLDFFLTSPQGTTVHFWDNSVCGSTDDFDFTINDSNPAFAGACNPISGSYSSSGDGETVISSTPGQNPTMFSAFNGESSAGTWTLTIEDRAAGDSGALDAWSLEVCGSEVVSTESVCLDDILNVSNDPGECGANVTVPQWTIIPPPTGGPPIYNGFVGPFDVANWTQDITGDNASIDLSGAPASVSFDGPDGGAGAAAATLEITIPADGTLSFDWDYFTTDGSVFDPFGYELNGVFTRLSFSNTDSGSESLMLSAGDVFAFSQTSIDQLFGDGATTVSNFLFEASAGTVSIGQGETFDNCGIASIVNDYNNTDDASDFYPVGTTTVTWTITDVNGNETTCSHDIEVVDTENPTIVCAADGTRTTLPTNPGECQYTVQGTEFDPIDVDDNCEVDEVVNDITGTSTLGGANLPVGTNVVTWTVTDIYGNSETCEVTIEIVDNENPVCMEPADVTISTEGDGDCGGYVPSALLTATATDNCGVASIANTSPFADFPGTADASGVYPVGTTTVFWFVTDVNGNITGCSTDVTIVDDEAPTIICPDPVVVNNDPGVCEAEVPDLTATADDNCDVDRVDYVITYPDGSTATGTSTGQANTETLNAGGIYPVGTSTVVFLVTDIFGNTTTCQANVTVNDNEPAVVTCADDGTRGTSEDGNPGDCLYTVQGAEFDATFVDNCPDATITNDYNNSASLAGADFDPGTTTVVWTVTDASGNVSTCSVDITVNDDEDPFFDSGQSQVCGTPTYFGGSTPIPSTGSGGSTSPDNLTVTTVTMGMDFEITEVNINNIGGTHTWVGDLDMWLESPTGTRVHFYDDPCTSDEDFSFNVSDSFNNDPASFCPPIGGVNLAPSGDGEDPFSGSTTGLNPTSLSAFNGELSAGTWTLYIRDNVGGDVGSLESWSLEICGFSVDTTCPDDITVDNDPGDCGAIVLYTDPVGMDNCPGVTTAQVAGLPSGSFFPVGTTTNIFVATDAAGNTATCEFDVTVNDVDVPTIECAADQTVTTSDDGLQIYDCNYTVIGTEFDPVSTDDNCGVAGVTNDYNNASSLQGANFPTGTTTVVWTVTDVNGLTATCSIDITVVDDEDPIASCVNNLNFSLNQFGQLTIPQFVIDNFVNTGSFDNCTDPNDLEFRLDITMFDCSNVGDNPVVMTVEDEAGNTSTCTTIINIQDNTAPECLTQDITIQLDGTGNATIAAADVDAGTNDACGIDNLAVSPDAFTCAEVGDNTVTLTATDVNGNVSTCTATVTVEDVTPPMAVCMNITIELDDNGSAIIDGMDIDGGSTDECGIASLSAAPSSFNCSNVGDNVVVLIVTDVNGNNQICTSTVTVEDNIAPVAVCNDNTVQLDANGDHTIDAAALATASTDACGPLSFSADPATVDCDDVGDVTVTVTVTDANGNSSTCTSTVTVEDNVAPDMVCTNIILPLDANGMASITPADVDGGSTDACGIADLSVDVMDFDCSDVGTQSVTLTAVDVNGNSASCTAFVIVTDNMAPDAVCQDITVELDVNGEGVVTGSDVDGGSTDNCGIASLEVNGGPSVLFGCSDVGQANTVQLTVTDVNGNSSQCTSNVTVEDNVAPDAVCQDITVQLNIAGFANITAADVDGGSSDACGISTISASPDFFTCNEVGDNNVTLTVVDVNGNVATCTAVVTVEDSIDPEALCSDATISVSSGGSVTVLPSDVNAGSNDPCGIDNIELTDLATGGPATYDCSDVGTTVQVLVTVTDVNGNVGTCISDVSIVDEVNPVAVCVQDIVLVLDNTGNGVLTAANVNNGSSDNCTLANIQISKDLENPGVNALFDCTDIGINVVVLTVTDASGNQNTCSADVDVQDGTPPTALCQDITVTLGPSGSVTIDPSDVDAGSSDECCLNTLSLSQTTFTAVGQFPVVLTVEDCSGNNATCLATVTVNPPTTVSFCPTILLQSAFNPFGGGAGAPDFMVTNLANNGLIPLSQPYNGAPWFYAGGETLAAVPGDMVDWGLLVVRDGADPNIVLGRAAVVIRSDGSVTDVNGGIVALTVSSASGYFVEMVHRNHLPITSALALQPDPSGNICWDFTTDMEQAFRDIVLNDDPQVELPGLFGLQYGLISGNAQSLDQQIDANDINFLLSDYLMFGLYSDSDVNMDGAVDANDINLLFGNYNSNAHTPY
ncbi:MAG: HYR domain-containing protein [Bacteroidota bacterium]